MQKKGWLDEWGRKASEKDVEERSSSGVKNKKKENNWLNQGRVTSVKWN